MDIIGEMVGKDIKPPYIDLDRDQEMEMAVRQLFTAHELAMRRGHHPKLWAAVKGSPFEREYRRRFNVGEGEDPKRFLQHAAPLTQFTVDSKWEDWTVDGQGNVMAHGEAKSAGRPRWRNVKKFDVEGYKQRTGHYPAGTINIYDISYWQHDGSKITSPYEMRSFMGGPRRARQEAEDPKSSFKKVKLHDFYKNERWYQIQQQAARSRASIPSVRRAPKKNRQQEAEDPKRFMLKRPRCRKCGCRLFNGFCSDDACPHSNWAQDVKVGDLHNLNGAELRRKYPRGKRSWVGEAENPKKVFHRLPRRHDIAAFSGDWVTDREGNVVAFTPDYSASDDDPNEPDTQLEMDIARYERIKKFDFDEYRAYWGDVPDSIDISDIGYWNEDGTYHKANAQYRRDIKTGGIAR